MGDRLLPLQHQWVAADVLVTHESTWPPLQGHEGMLDSLRNVMPVFMGAFEPTIQNNTVLVDRPATDWTKEKFEGAESTLCKPGALATSSG